MVVTTEGTSLHAFRRGYERHIMEQEYPFLMDRDTLRFCGLVGSRNTMRDLNPRFLHVGRWLGDFGYPPRSKTPRMHSSFSISTRRGAMDTMDGQGQGKRAEFIPVASDPVPQTDVRVHAINNNTLSVVMATIEGTSLHAFRRLRGHYTLGQECPPLMERDNPTPPFFSFAISPSPERPCKV